MAAKTGCVAPLRRAKTLAFQESGSEQEAGYQGHLNLSVKLYRSMMPLHAFLEGIGRGSEAPGDSMLVFEVLV